MKKKIIIGSILIISLLLLCPCINAVEYQEVKEKQQELTQIILNNINNKIIKFVLKGIVIPVIILTLYVTMGVFFTMSYPIAGKVLTILSGFLIGNMVNILIESVTNHTLFLFFLDLALSILLNIFLLYLIINY